AAPVGARRPDARGLGSLDRRGRPATGYQGVEPARHRPHKERGPTRIRRQGRRDAARPGARHEDDELRTRLATSAGPQRAAHLLVPQDVASPAGRRCVGVPDARRGAQGHRARGRGRDIALDPRRAGPAREAGPKVARHDLPHPLRREDPETPRTELGAVLLETRTPTRIRRREL
ncbi:MAG: DNA double-strand break repair nuclease NurA, partial [uncultured Rubrobacteraceae bacterium]